MSADDAVLDLRATWPPLRFQENLKLVIVEQGPPTLMRAALKIPAGRNQADNFWRDDNILGGIDIDTGMIFRAIQRGGPREVEADTHPDTGAAIKGLTLPGWDAAKALCLKAA
ncbi:MAG: sugar-transfer associated ATP-grasp domain-containing protein [Pseudomonadota bacterium]|nr:sugar-transfer associated ATP-grasp domain-containing protein [Pseudomonadota bacterium]